MSGVEETAACAECQGTGVIENTEDTEDARECTLTPFERAVAERVRLNGGVYTRYINPGDAL